MIEHQSAKGLVAQIQIEKGDGTQPSRREREMQKDSESGKGALKDEESLSEGVGRIADSAREVAADAADLAKQQVQQVRKYAEERTEEVVSWIKERPIASVLIGAAIGYLLGRMARR